MCPRLSALARSPLRPLLGLLRHVERRRTHHGAIVLVASVAERHALEGGLHAVAVEVAEGAGSELRFCQYTCRVERVDEVMLSVSYTFTFAAWRIVLVSAIPSYPEVQRTPCRLTPQVWIEVATAIAIRVRPPELLAARGHRRCGTLVRRELARKIYTGITNTGCGVVKCCTLVDLVDGVDRLGGLGKPHVLHERRNRDHHQDGDDRRDDEHLEGV